MAATDAPAAPEQPPPEPEPEAQPPPLLAVIAGGGPAGTAVLVRAARLGRLAQLLKEGTVVVDAGPAGDFGGGRLGDYLCRSNTFARNFAKNVVDDAPALYPPERAGGTPLEPLRASAVGQQLVAIGSEPVALELVGAYLREVGGALRSDLGAGGALCDTRVLSVQQRADGSWTTVVLARGQPRRELHSRCVVLATGGGQSLASVGEADVPMPLRPKLFLSDEVLRQSGFRRLQTQLQLARARGPTKICIVGGSHSGFSAAWLLLNPPSAAEVPPFGPRDIAIVHTSAIKVYYASRREAEADGYTDFTAVNRHGMVHAYGGLRGDAKELFRRVRSGAEGRVRLYPVKRGGSRGVVQRLMADAAAIVWACGYESNEVPVLDAEGKRVTLAQSRGLVSVDNEARVLRANGAVLPGLFGIGLGYGLRADEDGFEGRADGVAVYQKRAATLVLAGLVGAGVFGDGCRTWEEKQAKQAALEAARSRPSPEALAAAQRQAVARLSQPAYEAVLAAAPEGPGPGSEPATASPRPAKPPIPEERRKSLQDAHVQRMTAAQQLAQPPAAEKRCPYDGCDRAFGPNCTAKKARAASSSSTEEEEDDGDGDAGDDKPVCPYDGCERAFGPGCSAARRGSASVGDSPAKAKAAEPAPAPPSRCPYDGCARAYGPGCSRRSSSSGSSGRRKSATARRRRRLSATVPVTVDTQLNGSPPPPLASPKRLVEQHAAQVQQWATTTPGAGSGPGAAPGAAPAPAPAPASRPLSSPIRRARNRVGVAPAAEPVAVSPIRQQRPYVKPRPAAGLQPLVVMGQGQSPIRRAQNRQAARFFKLPVVG